MKKKFTYGCLLLSIVALSFGCKRDSDYVISTPSDYIANLDLRKIYMGKEVELTKENMRGATIVKGQVISDHSGNNLPAGLLILQNLRTAGNGIDSLRGIAINIGSEASKYVPGDSVHVFIEGAKINRIDGILTVTGVSPDKVEKKASGKMIISNRGFANLINQFPDRFESTLLNIVKGTYNPTLTPAATLAGEKVLNDGTDNVRIITDNGASFANMTPPYSGNYKGIIFNKVDASGKLTPYHKVRVPSDIVTLSSTVDIPEIIITGFLNDPMGSDSNNEYIQFKATRDIDFAITPFSVTTCNNAGATVPTGVPALGWATGQAKTYKFEIKSGTVKKGEFFYIGAPAKLINGPSSSEMTGAKFIHTFSYNNTASPRFNSERAEFGTASTNLLANSGNAFGMAVFRGLEVTAQSQPIDVVFVHNTGSLYTAGAAPTYGAGYRIGNTDVYDVIDPLTGRVQPYFLAGSNTQRFTYYGGGSDLGAFYQLGGTFDTGLGKWVKARSNGYVVLTKTSTVSEIEGENSTEIK
ncbi:MAG: hypothetical protein EOO99_00250 [Pedobacter sp.]|nr:MAG: hypothetical protein EOO99_00250 [Pedobacter sp.]